MHPIRRWLLASLALLLPLASAQAQTYTHAVYLDFDRDTATGCSVTTPAGVVAGAEARVSATVSGQPPIVTAVVRERCDGGSFGPAEAQPAGHPVGLNLGAGGSDVVEFSTVLTGLGNNGLSNLTFVSSSATGADLVVAQGVSIPGPGAIVAPAIVPTAGWLALLLLVAAMLWIVRRNPRFGASMAVLLLLGAGVVWAAHFALDGQVGDWAGLAPRATDPANDATTNEPGIDLIAVHAQPEGSRLFLRSDVRDAQNQPPVADAQSVSLLEEGTISITLTASDPEGAALDFAIATAPTRGTLSAITPIDATSASVDYTGNLDEVGADSFSFIASDGIADSAPATVSITLDPVNDAPSLASVDPPAVLEDAGAASVPGWAVFVAGPADEAAQVPIAYTVTDVGTPALFSVAPSIAVDGTLSYTPAPDANGTSTFTVTVQDDGGVANGGVDTSTPQTWTITVVAVNDAPGFVAGADPTSAEDAGPQTIAGWATALDDGDPEVTQALGFGIGAIGNPALFATPPALTPGGDLSYTSAPDAFGSSTVEIRIQDDGGTANGGVDASPYQTITITVTPVDDAPIANADSATVAEDSAATPIDVLANDADVDAGPIAIDTVTQPANGTVTINGTDVSYAPAPDYCNTDPAAPADTFTYALAPGGSFATVSVTVTCVNDAPVNTVPGAQNVGTGATLTFSAANANAIGVDDLDAGSGVVQITLSADDGTIALNPAAIAALDSLVGQGTATLVATGTVAELNAALEGATYTAPAVPPPPPGAVTLTLETDDLGNTGSGGALADSDTITIVIDNAPAVQSIAPADGATRQALDADVVVTFTEAIDALAGAVSVACAPSGASAGSIAQSNVTAITVSGATLGAQEGDSCSVTVSAAAVTDVDAIDPPDQMAADVFSGWSVDVAPAFVASTPAAASTVATDVTFSAGFSEAVNAAAGAITLDCGGAIAGTLSGSGTNTLVFTPDAELPAGADCTATIVAASVTDVDAGDPPDALPADVTVTFATDAAPAVTGGTPAAGATGVATTSAVTFTFSEAVDATAGAITLDCDGAIAGTLSGSGTTTLMFTPSAPLPEATLCTAIAVAANIDDSDAIDPPDALPADVARSFTTDAAPAVIATTPNDGEIDVSLLGVVTFTFSEPVSFSGASFTYFCDGDPVAFGVAGDGTASATLTPLALLPINTPCIVTALAAGIDDVDAGDPPANLAADVVVGFTTVDDNPPAVIASTPDASTPVVASNVAISFTLSEPVDAAADYATLTCGGANLIAAGLTGADTTTLTPAYVGDLPAGATCTLTLRAAAITDSDAIDPPDAMTADYVVEFSVDAAPAVASTSPADGATSLGTGTTITIDFTEPVDIASAGAFSIECGGTPVGFTTSPLVPASASSYTLTPSAPLPANATCTVSVFAAQVADTDTIDPPQNMTADYYTSFTTDAAPAVTAISPAEAAVVSTTQAIQVDFSEAVDLGAAAFTLDCGGAVALGAVPALPATGTTTVTLTPSGGLPEGSACVFTVVASEVSDTDGNDPPDTMLADVVRNFSVDAAPSVLGTTPADGATNISPSSPITITFSESVNFDTTANAANTSFGFACGAATSTDFTVLGTSPAASVVLDPDDDAAAGTTCTLTVRASGITDADLLDPPQNPAVDHVASFSFAALAEDDAYEVTPHLTLSIPAAPAGAQGGGVRNNDTLGSGTITGFGLPPTCSSNAPGTSLDGGPATGRLTLNADGSLAYEPPVGVANATRTFCYTVTGGDTANIAFVLQNAELVWFVDANAAAGGTGTQARPFQTVGAAAAVDTTGDTIHIASGNYPNTAIVLATDERVIGDGSSATIATFTGIEPVEGSAFPVLSGVAPVLSCSDATCVGLAAGAGNVNRLRGFTIANSGAAGRDIQGAGFGMLEVAEVTLTGNGTALDLANGTLVGGFIDINVNGSNGDGISLSAVGGDWTVTQAVDLGPLNGRGLAIVNAPSTTSIVFPGGTNVNKSTPGTGIHLTGNNAAALLNLGSVAITTTGGSGLFVNGSPLTLTGTSSTITTSGAPAIDATNVTFTGGATLATVSSSASPAEGISLNGVNGGLTINGGTITNPAGVAFLAQGGLTAVTYAGAISKDSVGNLVQIAGNFPGNVTLSGALTCNAPCAGIDVLNRGAGTITFSGATKMLNTGTNTAVELNNNDSATINFTNGGLDIDTTSGTGFNAVNGAAAITVVGPGNTIRVGPAAALNVNASTIGAAGLNFVSIHSNGGGTPGITLNGSGPVGGLAVTGAGGACTTAANCTGGAIENKSVDGISLINARSVSLNRMFIAGNGGSGVFGDDLTNFTLENSRVLNNADTATGAEAGLRFNELLGNSALVGNTFAGSFEDHVRITPASGVLTNLAVLNNTFNANSATTGGHALAWIATGTAQGTIHIGGNVFDDIRSSCVLVNVANSAAGSVFVGGGPDNVSGNTFTDCGAAVTVQSSDSADLTYDVKNNATIVRSIDNAVQLVTGSTSLPASQINGEVNGNNIGNGSADSGSRDRYGIAKDLRGDQQSIWSINANNVRNTDFSGIWVSSADFGVVAGPSAVAHMTVRDNTVGTIDDNSEFPVFGLWGTLIDVRHTTTGCLDMFSNTSTGTLGLEHFRLRQRDTSIFRLERLSDGDAMPGEQINSVALVEAHIVSQNDPGSTADATLVTGFSEAADNACLSP